MNGHVARLFTHRQARHLAFVAIAQGAIPRCGRRQSPILSQWQSVADTTIEDFNALQSAFRTHVRPCQQYIGQNGVGDIVDLYGLDSRVNLYVILTATDGKIRPYSKVYTRIENLTSRADFKAN